MPGDPLAEGSLPDETWLHVAIRLAVSLNDASYVDWLFSGFDSCKIDIKNNGGEAPLLLLSRLKITNDNIETVLSIMTLLCEKGADVNTQDLSGNTPSHHAAAKGNFQMLQLFYNHNADWNLKTRIQGRKTYTPIGWAEYWNKSELAKQMKQPERYFSKNKKGCIIS